MFAMSSCVMLNESVDNRSMLKSSQRHNCCSTEWWRLHTAVCVIWVISACV